MINNYPKINTGPLTRDNVAHQLCSDWLKGEMLRLFDMIDDNINIAKRQSDAITLLVDAITKPREGVLLHPQREYDLLHAALALVRANNILHRVDGEK